MIVCLFVCLFVLLEHHFTFFTHHLIFPQQHNGVPLPAHPSSSFASSYIKTEPDAALPPAPPPPPPPHSQNGSNHSNNGAHSPLHENSGKIFLSWHTVIRKVPNVLTSFLVHRCPCSTLFYQESLFIFCCTFLPDRLGASTMPADSTKSGGRHLLTLASGGHRMAHLPPGGFRGKYVVC